MILLYILLVLFILAAIIFLTPLQYQIKGAIGSNTNVSIFISWLFRLVTAGFTYENGKSSFYFRIAFFNLTDRNKKPKKILKKPQPVSPEAEQPKDDRPETDQPPLKKTKPKKQKLPKSEKKKEKNLIGTIRNYISQLKAVLTYPERKIIMSLVMRFFKKTVHALKPKKIRLKGVVGLSDPFVTGLLLGAYEACSGMFKLRRDIQLEGDFNKKTIDMDVFLAGRISMCSVFYPVIWLITRRPILRLVIRYIRSKSERNERDGKRKRK